MKYSIKQFKQDVLACIELSEKELADRRKGINGESTIDQIENTILPDLNRVLKIIEQEELPPQQDRYLVSFAYAFRVWGWDMQNPTELYIKLSKLNEHYKDIGEETVSST